MNTERTLEKRLELLHTLLIEKHAANAMQGTRNVRVISAIDALPNGYGAIKSQPRLAKIAQVRIDDRNVKSASGERVTDSRLISAIRRARA